MRDIIFGAHGFSEAQKEKFDKSIETMKKALAEVSLCYEKQKLIRFFIDVIGRDIAYETATAILYGDDIPYSEQFLYPFVGNESGEQQDVLFETINVVSCPWAIYLFASAFRDIDISGFVQDGKNCTGIYYPELRLMVCTNGYHHVSAAALIDNSHFRSFGNRGRFRFSAKCSSLEQYYDIVKTDGGSWYIDGQEPFVVHDFRMAVLYELAREFHKIRNSGSNYI